MGHIWLPICVYNEHLSIEGTCTLKGHMWLMICIWNELWSYDEPFMRYNHPNIMWPWFDLYGHPRSKAILGKVHAEILNYSAV